MSTLTNIRTQESKKAPRCLLVGKDTTPEKDPVVYQLDLSLTTAPQKDSTVYQLDVTRSAVTALKMLSVFAIFVTILSRK
jgi:hypothetical protein